MSLYKQVVMQPKNWNILLKIHGQIIHLYNLLKYYKHIKKDMKDWKTRSDEIEKVITNQTQFNYVGVLKCVNFLSEAVYVSGLTNIEWIREDPNTAINRGMNA